MFFRLFLLFTIVPLAELALLIQVGAVIGAASTIALVIFTGAVGAWLAREQGLRVIREFNDAVRRGDMPTDSLIDGFMVVIGGAFLITPGIVTDIAGFILVIPVTRRLIRSYIKKNIQSRIEVVSFQPGPSAFHYTSYSSHTGPTRRDDDDDIIDV